MSFDLPDAKPTSERTNDDDLGAKDLFETISEAHYLPELHGPHDEELLESLVEKGCEDNQILGQALDKLAHLVHHSEYVEEEEMLLRSAPVADIIDRLEQSLESPGRSSMTAAQGLLHLHQIAEHHAPAATYTPADDDVFAAPPMTSHSDCTMEALASSEDLPNNDDLTHIQYEMTRDEKETLDLETDIQDNHVLCAETVPETNEGYEMQPPECTSNLLDSELPPSNSELTIEITPPNCNINTGIPVQETENNFENEENIEDELPAEPKIEQEDPITDIDPMELVKEMDDPSHTVELVPTDLRVKHTERKIKRSVSHKCENVNGIDDNLSEKSDEQPRDLSVHRRLPTPHASPRRIEIPRAPSRESDAMQSPQPSGIPAVPSSPEIFSMPHTKSKQTLFLESLLSSPSPKMYTSEVTISKQQCEPLNLGKHRKSASPTITSCSDEIKKLNKEFGEPQEKRVRCESTEELAKISKVFNKCNEDVKPKSTELTIHKMCDETTPLQQLHILKSNPEYNIPDPLLVPRDKLDQIFAAPAREIPQLLIDRPELRLPEALGYPSVVRNPDLVVMTFTQLERILANEAKKLESDKNSESKTNSSKTTAIIDKPSKISPDQTGQVKSVPSIDGLAGDIDAATSAALNQMFWLPYISQLEAMAACSQNMDFLKALNSSGYSGPNYNDLSQMFPASRLMNPAGFPVMSQADYDNRLQFVMWQEAMNQANANASTSQRSKQSSMEAHMKEMAAKSSDVQNPYVHSTKNHQNKPHSSARTSPIAHNYNTNQRSMNHNPYLQGMYPGINPNIRPNMPLPGLQIPYFNPNMMGSQRSPRTSQQKSPTSPYFPNNNYLHSLKQSEAQGRQRTSSTSSQESPRPRISVKSLHNLLEPSAASGSSMRRTPNPPASLGRRREEPEVGSTTPLGEPPPPPLQPPHPHDPASFHLWHPLFGNQKSYNSPWPWTTVTATGD